MKVQIDKISSSPQYSLTAKKVKLALSILPEELTSSFCLVRLSNELPQVCSFDRLVILSNRLTICDRGIPELEIIEHIYIELAQRFPVTEGNIRAYYANRLNPFQLKELKKIVKPFVEKYMELSKIQITNNT